MAEAKRSRATTRTDGRVEADVVRLDAERLPSGLYRHRLVKFIFELARQKREGRLKR